MQSLGFAPFAHRYGPAFSSPTRRFGGGGIERPPQDWHRSGSYDAEPGWGRKRARGEDGEWRAGGYEPDQPRLKEQPPPAARPPLPSAAPFSSPRRGGRSAREPSQPRAALPAKPPSLPDRPPTELCLPPSSKREHRRTPLLPRGQMAALDAQAIRQPAQASTTRTGPLTLDGRPSQPASYAASGFQPQLRHPARLAPSSIYPLAYPSYPTSLRGAPPPRTAYFPPAPLPPQRFHHLERHVPAPAPPRQPARPARAREPYPPPSRQLPPPAAPRSPRRFAHPSSSPLSARAASRVPVRLIDTAPVPDKLKEGDANPPWLEEEIYGPCFELYRELTLDAAAGKEKGKGKGKGKKRKRVEEGEDEVVGRGIDYEGWEEQKRARKKAKR